MTEPMVHSYFKVVRNPDENGDRAYKKNKAAVIAEAGGMCVVQTSACTVQATTAHHIRGRRIPNPHAKSNLLAVCDACHNGSDVSIHANPEWAMEHGFMRSRTVLEDSSEHIRFQQVSGVDETDPDYLERFGLWVAELGAERAISECEGTGR